VHDLVCLQLSCHASSNAGRLQGALPEQQYQTASNNQLPELQLLCSLITLAERVAFSLLVRFWIASNAACGELFRWDLASNGQPGR
jgi:hypothetical protein